MKKKLFSTLFTFVTVTALAACSTSQTKESDSSSSTTVESSKVEESTSTSSSTSSSSSKTKTLKESTVVYLSDQEIEAVQTLGDAKAAFQSLSDAYVADFDELVAQLSERDQKSLAPFRDQLQQMMDQQRDIIENQFANFGDDTTQIPVEGRESMISALKMTRDQLKQAMTTVREQAQSMLQ